jgi:hypothetical protein
MMRRAEKIVSRAKDAKVSQIPVFPPEAVKKSTFRKMSIRNRLNSLRQNLRYLMVLEFFHSFPFVKGG